MSEHKKLENIDGAIQEEDEFLQPDGYGPEATEPVTVKRKLFIHQRKALHWMLSQGKFIILADDMGLGKTICSIAFALSLPMEDDCKSALIMVPKSLLRTWIGELEKGLRRNGATWCVVHGSFDGSFNKPLAELRKHCIILTTPDAVHRQYENYQAAIEARANNEEPTVPLNGWPLLGISRQEGFPGWLEERPWQLLCLDEAHSIRNEEGKKALSLANVHAKRKLALTGTPLQNNPGDLFSVLRFIGHPQGQDSQTFKKDIATPIINNNDYRNLHALQKACMLQRLRTHKIDGKPIVDLPPIHRIVHRVYLNETESKIYQEVEAAGTEDILVGGEGRPRGLYLKMITELRQTCTDPLLLLGTVEEHSPLSNDYKQDKALLVANSSRIPSLGAFLNTEDVRNPPAKTKRLLKVMNEVRAKDPDSRFLIYAEWTGCVMNTAYHLDQNSYMVLTFTGDLTTDERTSVIDRFEEENSDLDALILTLGAGGEGLNLTSANHVIILTPCWNPAKEAQAESRAHRLGQKSEVTVHYIRTLGHRVGGEWMNTVEVKIVKRQTMKRQWALGAAGRLDDNGFAIWEQDDDVGEELSGESGSPLAESDLEDINVGAGNGSEDGDEDSESGRSIC